MSDATKLIERIRRTQADCADSLAAAALIEQQAARIAALESAGRAEPIYQTCFMNGQWRDVDRFEYDRAKGLRDDLARIVYTAPAAIDNAGWRDAERWRYQALDAQAKLDRAVKILSRIHGFLTPEDVRLPDGRVMRFSNAEIEREMLRGLCAAIRAVPDEIAALSKKAGEQDASGS